MRVTDKLFNRGRCFYTTVSTMHGNRDETCSKIKFPDCTSLPADASNLFNQSLPRDVTIHHAVTPTQRLLYPGRKPGRRAQAGRQLFLFVTAKKVYTQRFETNVTASILKQNPNT